MYKAYCSDIHMYDRFGGDDLFMPKSDEKESKDLLIEIMMRKYDIKKSDLDNISIVKSKLRDINIDEILK